MAKAPQAAPKATNKWDFEIAKVRSRTELWRVPAIGCMIALCIAVAAVPLLAMHGIIQPLAGKHTQVNLDVPVSVGLSVSVVANLGQFIKGRSRRSEIKRERERADKHEAELGITV